jgi:enoyl-[acyl-carrier protein] reductase I
MECSLPMPTISAFLPGELPDIMDLGFACAYLATPYARRITGGTVYVDGGVNIMA